MFSHKHHISWAKSLQQKVVKVTTETDYHMETNLSTLYLNDKYADRTQLTVW